MESFAGADLHKRVTQLAVLREGQPPSQFCFPNDAKTVDRVLERLPQERRSRWRPRVLDGTAFITLPLPSVNLTGSLGSRS